MIPVITLGLGDVTTKYYVKRENDGNIAIISSDKGNDISFSDVLEIVYQHDSIYAGTLQEVENNFIRDIKEELIGKNILFEYMGTLLIDELPITFEEFQKLPVENDSQNVYINVGSLQASIDITEVIEKENEPFEASEILENNLEHPAWEKLYNDYLDLI